MDPFCGFNFHQACALRKKRKNFTPKTLFFQYLEILVHANIYIHAIATDE